MKYRSLIFDFDGTIADTLDEALSIYNEMAGEHNLRTIKDEEVHYLRHMKLSDFLDHLAVPKRLVPKLLYKGTRILKSRIKQLPMINGMAEVLPELRKQSDHFGILTSNSVENVELFLKHHGLQDVFSFVSSTSKLTGKAKHLRSICRTFSIEADEIIYLYPRMNTLVIAAVTGVIAGLLGALCGVGGGIVMVPAFVTVLGF
ncbi:HAD hydrolase-like protein, partial [Akkermansiaceae bacterium]|nr:HAD hydrolase-like protein [Akkermansiaceae bacterium]